MKNLLKSTLYLFAFAGAGILFQISCSNTNDALNVNNINKVIYTKNNGVTLKIFTCNYDGTSQTEIPVTLPTNMIIWNGSSQHAMPRIAPNGQTIFFLVQNITNNSSHLFKANIDGSGAVEIVSGLDGQIEIGNMN